MSMNIEIYAEPKEGKHPTIYFNAYQTPTNVTWQIMDSEDKIEAYIDWVLENWDVDEFDEEDDFMLNLGKYHVDELRAWLKVMALSDLTVKVCAG